MTDVTAASPHGQGRTWHWKDRMASCGPPRGSYDEWKAARWAIGGFFRTNDNNLGIDCDVRYQPCGAPRPNTAFSGEKNHG